MEKRSSSTRIEEQGAPDKYFYKNRILTLLICTGVVVGSFLVAPLAEYGPVICPLRGFTGVPCPSCGLTRAFCALASLDVAAALAFHVFSIPLAILFIVAPVVSVIEMIRKRRLRFYRFMFSARVAYVFAGSLIAYHVGRITYWVASGTFLSEQFTTPWPVRIFFS
jgi:hypothetical protein